MSVQAAVRMSGFGGFGACQQCQFGACVQSLADAGGEVAHSWCNPWNEFVLDSSRIEFADKLYKSKYKRALPQRVRDLVVEQHACSQGEIGWLIDRAPPCESDIAAVDVQPKPQPDGSSGGGGGGGGGGGFVRGGGGNRPGSGLSTGAIVGIAAGGVGVLGLILILVLRR